MILLFTLETWGPEQMLERDEALNGAFDLIARHPHISERSSKRSGQYRRKFVHPHFIYYHRVENEIVIVRIVHQREDVFARI
jgi:plasmid stabilization system protein ParE